MSSVMEELRGELLDDISAHTQKVLQDMGINEEVAEQASFTLTEHLAQNWAGQTIHIPKDHLYKLAKRDLQIYEEFNGRNYAQLARKHKMGVRGMYKLIERVHKRKIAEAQPDLFN
ncbi:Mor transcription activator family protein [Neptuniibacter sp.]|uniref:Mor transcription activator family protein n=1 Tax=Neptuniibacter sp. TaxID=1962643 RepID=UPI003B59BBCE